MIRAPEDPDRKPRPKGGQADKQPHLTLTKVTPESWMPRIQSILADGRPRTLNAIGTELIDKTADITSGTPFEEALWRLVELGRVEYTHVAPVRFRLRRGRARRAS